MVIIQEEIESIGHPMQWAMLDLHIISCIIMLAHSKKAATS